MDGAPDPDDALRRRRFARLAIAAAAAGVLLLLIVAGPKSVVLLGVGAVALVAFVMGLWWTMARRGPVRILAAGLAVAAPVAAIVLYAAAGLLWLVLLCLALWAGAASAGWTALGAGSHSTTAREQPAAPPSRPYLIMNPRSGDGKVERFGLREKAEALGARVVLLDPGHHQDVVALARRAAADGADLLGVAGGDGTQALVADVAAAHGLPFMVVPAGTRNHFALDLGLDRDDPAKCLTALTDGVELRVDLGRVGERAFVNNASFGAYATVVGSRAYRDDKIRTILRLLPDALSRHTGPHLRVHAEGDTIDAPQAVLVSNNPYRVGDSAGLGRRDRLDGGVLGLLGIKVDTAAEAADMLLAPDSPGLTLLTTHEAVIEADTPEVAVGVDGEALTLPTPVRCAIEPGALRVRVPRRRPGVPRAKPPLDWRRLYALATTTGRPGRAR
ncbi:diacylglycerol/lipid kinase family protein [Streptomyces hesseae]|uniref:Diacylglycerol kinase family protein n=1 Tax=Streptomyces hesseae TaxID=3075519 RepID=A0ABU2SNU3_9ACTN|nr:diacylglycerol kinase family protein [Streptomyces sp. DSM 40473]MDT0449579.1 diacylglycerol kinase family protein [Streptomyces sp. DSM 40473]